MAVKNVLPIVPTEILPHVSSLFQAADLTWLHDGSPVAISMSSARNTSSLVECWRRAWKLYTSCATTSFDHNLSGTQPISGRGSPRLERRRQIRPSIPNRTSRPNEIRPCGKVSVTILDFLAKDRKNSNAVMLGPSTILRMSQHPPNTKQPFGTNPWKGVLKITPKLSDVVLLDYCSPVLKVSN